MRRALLAACILASVDATAREPLFRVAEPLGFPLGAAPGPGRLIVADLSGDSRDDLAVLAAEIVVFITGAPAPVPDLARTSYPVATPGPLFLAGDLDGDALLDLLAGAAAAVQVLRNTGGGSFANASSVPVDGSPRAGKLVDLDDDGFLDLVTLNRPAAGGASLAFLLGDAKGGFLPEVRRSLEGDVFTDSFAIEAFGEDDRPDIALSVASPGPRIRVLPGQGGTALGEPIDTPLGASPRHVASGYIDPDARPDLAVIAGLSGRRSSQVLYLENSGADEFVPDTVGEEEPPADLASEILRLTDFDEDGILDIITRLERDGLHGLRVRYGGGAGDFPRSADQVLAGGFLDFGLLDTTGEGIRDLAAVESGDLAIYLGLEPGRFDLPGKALLDASPLGVASFDWSGDGKLDIAAHASGVFYLLRGDGQGRLEPVLRREESGSLEHMVIAEFPGDSRPALADTAGGRVLILEIGTDGSIASTKDVQVGGAISGLAAAGFDGYVGSELILSDSSSGDAKMIFDLAGSPRTTPIDAGEPQTAVDAGDVDGDRAQDVVLARGTGLRILFGDGAGAFLRVKDLPVLANARSVRVEHGDSGSPKGIAGVTAEGSSLVWIADPLGAGEPLDIADGSELASVRAIDIDGDYIVDLLATARGPEDVLQARLGLRGGGFGSPEAHGVGLDPGAFALVDLDGDGLTDAVTADSGSRTLSVAEGYLGQRESADSFRRGDADADGTAAITDAIVVLNWLFQGGPEPGCRDAADSDDSGVLDLTDPIRLLDFLFRGGPEPPAPGTAACGEDPTADELVSCEADCR